MELARKSVLGIKPYIPGKPIEEVKRELGIEGDIIKLASNENPLGPSPKAIEAINRMLKSLHLYPDDTSYYLKNKLSEHLNIPVDYIITGNGSCELIHLVAKACINPGEKVVLSKPTFIMGKIESQIFEAELAELPVKGNRHDIDAIIDALDNKTKLLYIDNPNNPLGSMLTAEELDRVVKSLPENTLLVVDEAYREYITREDFPETIDYVRKGLNVVVLRTFSKIYGLAGLRVGYGIARPEIINILHRVRLPFNVNSIAQKAAIAALDDTEHVERSRKLVEEGKRFLYKEFEKMGIHYIPSEANFVTIKLEMDAKEINSKLMKKGIIARPLNPYGLKNYLRVTIGTLEGNAKFIDALKEIIT